MAGDPVSRLRTFFSRSVDPAHHRELPTRPSARESRSATPPAAETTLETTITFSFAWRCSTIIPIASCAIVNLTSSSHDQ
jgi:hypothetical protein